jgi:hypothetical protein
MMWAGLAGVALLAQGWGALATRHAMESRLAGGSPAPVGRGLRIRLAIGAALLWVHLLFAPLQAVGNSVGFDGFKPIRETAYDRVMLDHEVSRQMVVLLNPPIPFMASTFPAYLDSIGRPFPERFRMLASGVYPLKLTTLDAHTISIRSEGGGILQPRGTWDVPGQPRDPAVSLNYLPQMMDSVFRSARFPFRVGEVTETIGMTAEVIEVAPGGGVNEVRFTFEEPLTDPDLRWLKWEGEGFVEITLPSPGESLEMPAIDLGGLL